MKSLKFFFILVFLTLSVRSTVSGESGIGSGIRRIAVVWHKTQSKGVVEVLNGRLLKIETVEGKGKIRGNSFDLHSNDQVRIVILLDSVHENRGSGATLVTIRTDRSPFTFFLRDVSKEFPIYIPDYQVMVSNGDDLRSYNQVETELKNRHLRGKLQQIADEPEESFETAAAKTRNQSCPTWLGISRDVRIFELFDNRTNVASEMNMIRPHNSSSAVKIPGSENKTLEYSYLAGRGQGVSVNVSRRLEEGILPILHTSMVDEDIEYYSTAFVSTEKSPLTARTPIGTDFLVADQFSGGHMLTKGQQELAEPRLVAEKGKSETTVLYYRCEARNKSAVPRYAWFKTIRPGAVWWIKNSYSFNSETGFSSFPSGEVFGISKLNGHPLHDEEIAVLLQPDETASFEFFIPHTPVSGARAVGLAQQSFDDKLNECKLFWKAKLGKAAQITVPEKRINEMISAGLLHLDLITYGNEPDGTLTPAIGVYSPIGTESSPIVQFYNSMGLPDIARRSLNFFLEKQHDDGMIQNFGGYMVETGAALWSMGEYFRYTRDREWVRQAEPKLIRACDFLIRWRNDNKKEALRGKGYGMIAGKVADPEDPFHQYMLNGYACLGLSRVAEMLKDIDNEQSARLQKEADSWKQDIRSALMYTISNSPVVPLGDGRWSPTVPPWTEAIGPRALHIVPETYVSHGTVTAPDVLLGPLYLVFCEVLAPDDPVSKMMLDYHSELFYQNNAAFSQPYYSRHNWIQLKLGMTKPFLKTWYNTFSALADRETYTFWEHLFQVSAHKTHEEGWFLMETRWMLYLEEGQTLSLLAGIPRKWMENGKQISLKNVASYFGPVSLQVNSTIQNGSIDATITCDSEYKPRDVKIRLPHPDGKKAVKVTGGSYDPLTESVLIKNFGGTANIKAEF